MSNKPKTLNDERFEHAISFALAHEGGYSNDIDDDGGETKFGISKRSYPHVDVDTLTVEQIKAIYKRDFWEPQLYKDIKDVNLATKVFDLAVNMGSNWAHRLVQRALRVTGQDILEDGILGPITLAAINKADLTDLLAALKSEAAGYYRTLENLDEQNKSYRDRGKSGLLERLRKRRKQSQSSCPAYPHYTQ